ncbi:MAG TPA: metallophosphoesterase family protein [Coleofasciculaceae cyanobacterium]
MRILAIGDIHGCTIAFDTLLTVVKPRPNDKIITLGDYVDRGPNSKGTIERLIALHKTGQLTALRGNHEVMMLQARCSATLPREGRHQKRSDWLGKGGDATLASHAKFSKADKKLAKPAKLADIPESHWDFIESTCVDWCETEHHFFVHANAHPDIPLAQQPNSMLFWEKFDNPAPHCSGKIMVCGHTSQRSGIPINLGHAICIDTRVYGKGWLTCLDVMSGRVWQANQAGNVRTAWINQFASRPIKLRDKSSRYLVKSAR